MALTDYLTQRPTAGVSQGIQRGLQLGAAMDVGAANKLQAEELQRKKTAALQLQTDLTAFSEKEDKSPEDYSQMMIKYPSLAEEFKKSFDVLDVAQQQNKLSTATKIYAAMESGSIDLAKDLLTEQIEAAKNAGNEKDQKAAEVYLKIIENNPNAAKTSLGLMLSATMGGDKFSTTFKTLGEERRTTALQPGEIKKQKQEIIKYGVDNNLTKVQTEKALFDMEKTSAETKKLILDMEIAKTEDPNKFTGTEAFNAEEKLRKEYNAKTKGLIEYTRAYDNLFASSQDGTGAGDIALVTSFMKMLDPGSVVRETEFATARDTAGLFDILKNQAQKIQDGKFLTPQQRKNFAGLAKKYLESAKKQEVKTRRGLEKVVKNYNLNPENVFVSGEEEPEVVAGGEVQTQPTTVEPKSYLKYAKE